MAAPCPARTRAAVAMGGCACLLWAVSALVALPLWKRLRRSRETDSRPTEATSRVCKTIGIDTAQLGKQANELGKQSNELGKQANDECTSGLRLQGYAGVACAQQASSAISAKEQICLGAAVALRHQVQHRVCVCGAFLEGTKPHDEMAHMNSTRHRRNLQALGSTQLVVTENWAEYRRMVRLHVTAADCVCEVGCGRGVTTELLARRCGTSRVLGIDLSEKVIALARERYPELRFEVLNALDLSAVRKLGDFNKIFVDINGSRELETLLPLLEAYETALKPALLVVKSVRLKQLMLRCRFVWEAEADAAAEADAVGAEEAASGGSREE